MIWHILDIFFVIFHSSVIIFNITGWVWNLVVLLLTGSSWLFLGLIVGVLGYCPFTDWHFRVLEKIGSHDLPNSYIKYLADRITGFDLNASLVDNITLWTFIAALLLSLFLNIRDYCRSEKQN
jgi:hypothetical protein